MSATNDAFDSANEDRAKPPIDEMALTRQAHEVWERKAAFWDEMMGEGNAFQRFLVGPAIERLLEVRQGETVLDIACGNGVFSRRLAELGASVVATDFSEKFVELARTRTERAGYGDAVEYLVADATDAVAVARVEFHVNGAKVGSDTSLPYSYTWNSASIADGPATISH